MEVRSRLEVGGWSINSAHRRKGGADSHHTSPHLDSHGVRDLGELVVRLRGHLIRRLKAVDEVDARLVDTVDLAHVLACGGLERFHDLGLHVRVELGQPLANLMVRGEHVSRLAHGGNLRPLGAPDAAAQRRP